MKKTFSILLSTAPMVQINTPYPATTYLTGFLHSRYTKDELKIHQNDPAIELICRLFSKNGLKRIQKNILSKKQKNRSPSVIFFLDAYDDYASTVEKVIHYLQGKAPELTEILANNDLVPEGPRFLPLREEIELQKNYTQLSKEDQAKHIASLFLDDLADVIRDGVDSRFEFSRYGERLAASQTSLSPLLNALEESSLVDEILEEITEEFLTKHQPDLWCISAPFSGTVYGAFRMATVAKKIMPSMKIALGGGYVNTELRELSDPRVFQFFDFISLDDGERPLQCLLEYLQGTRQEEKLLRTFREKNGKVVFISDPSEHDILFKDSGTPSYNGLPLNNYIAMFEALNPVQRLWSAHRWNKLTLAHGCYWKKCSFCDTSLPYIKNYENSPADLLIDRMITISKETSTNGFHFVDEAAPPATLSELSNRLIERNLNFTWWGNIRFEKTFTPELTKRMAKAGCIAVTGGLEVASPRILKLIQKGVTIEQVAKVTKSFFDAGIFVHAYLMYGFPTETTQETIDSLEVVRQLFENSCLQSAYWHRFSVTVHSPIGKNPENFGITLLPNPAPKEGIFAKNDIAFFDPTAVDHTILGLGLRKALFNYMHGIGIQADVREWFEVDMPKTKLSATLIKRALT